MEMILDGMLHILTEKLKEFETLSSDVETGFGLGEIRRETKHLHEILEMIEPVLADAQRKSLRDKNIKFWLRGLRDALRDSEELIDMLIYVYLDEDCSLNKNTSSSFSVLSFSKRAYRTTRTIRNIVARITEVWNMYGSILEKKNSEDIFPNKDTTFSLSADACGREEEIRNMVEELLMKGKEWDLVLGIVGMGGIGKTTLAQMVFNNEAVCSYFDIRLWICVSTEYTEPDILRRIISSACGYHGEADTMDELMLMVSNLFSHRRFLIVLDDIWHGNSWEDLFNNMLSNRVAYSRILITTRDEGLLRRMGAFHVHRLKVLSVEDGWMVLCRLIFGSGQAEEIEELQEIGIKIVRKCSGLPLLIKAVSDLLIAKERARGVWESCLENLEWSSNEDVTGIMSAQYLSYDVLPSELKQCFLYFSLFPDDYEFHRWSLIPMWIAEGYVVSHGEQVIEDVANEFYMELITRSIIQVTDSDHDRQRCRMHFLLQALARSLAHEHYITEYVRLIDDTSRRECLYLSMIDKQLTAVPSAIKGQECLKTLLLSHNPLPEAIPDDLFNGLKLICVLDLSHTGITKLPVSIKKLLHLKYLNLSFTKLRELPGSIQNLQNLQTLNIDCCKHLHRLPSGIIQLSRLRHLMMRKTKINNLPIGFGKLTSLRMLNSFVVDDGDSVGNKHLCNLKELKDLSELRHLSAYKLEMVPSEVDAIEAALGSKTHLNSLKLSCTRAGNCHQYEEALIKRIKNVFEGLMPPRSLEKLSIKSYFGCELPFWISADSLPNLNYLKLKDCILCNRIPQLSQLPQLVILHISGLSAITSFSPESFFGGVGKAFPKLEILTIEEMFSWEEWHILDDGVFSCLRRLVIVSCPKLRHLPEGLKHATALSDLEIRDCNSLTTIENLFFITDMKLVDNCKLRSIGSFHMLQKLTVENCPMLKNVTDIDKVRNLLLEDVGANILPAWVVKIKDLHRLVLVGNISLLRRCDRDCEEWAKIEHISHVEAKSHDGSKFVSYTKSPFSFRSNL